MLIASPRHTPRDLEQWAIYERTDALEAKRMRPTLDVLARKAAHEMRTFLDAGPDGRRGYLGVSWGKDSVVTAHIALTHGIHVPLVWVRVDDRENPDCVLVRDAFLAMHPTANYHEVEARTAKKGLTSSEGFAQAERMFGKRHISGVRAQESAVRRLRTAHYGLTTENTCAPIGHWKVALHVFPFIHAHGLPLHPAYACTQGGMYDRNYIRVGSLGGDRGTGHGRRAWERAYYSDELTDALAARERDVNR